MAGGRRPLGIAKGFRSGLEDTLSAQQRALGLPVRYETLKLPYEQPATSHEYTPDFLLGSRIIVESKGYFPTEDRNKMLLVRKHNPGYDIRFVFTNSRTFMQAGDRKAYSEWLLHVHKRKAGNAQLFDVWRSTKKTPRAVVTYAEWAVKHGFPFADKEIPLPWFVEAYGKLTLKPNA